MDSIEGLAFGSLVMAVVGAATLEEKVAAVILAMRHVQQYPALQGDARVVSLLRAWIAIIRTSEEDVEKAERVMAAAGIDVPALLALVG